MRLVCVRGYHTGTGQLRCRILRANLAPRDTSNHHCPVLRVFMKNMRVLFFLFLIHRGGHGSSLAGLICCIANNATDSSAS